MFNKLIDSVIELLAYAPFVMVAGSKHPDRRVSFNWPDFMRTLFTAIVVVLLVNGWLWMENKTVKQEVMALGMLASDTNKKINKMCEDTEVYRRATESRLAVLETRQNERLERERARGIRK